VASGIPVSGLSVAVAVACDDSLRGLLWLARCESAVRSRPRKTSSPTCRSHPRPARKIRARRPAGEAAQLGALARILGTQVLDEVTRQRKTDRSNTAAACPAPTRLSPHQRQGGAAPSLLPRPTGRRALPGTQLCRWLPPDGRAPGCPPTPGLPSGAT
jgi:hypothetical protein